jgi:flagellar protein FliO/FliZ
MNLAEIARMLAALAVTLGLGGLTLVAVKRFMPMAVLKLKTPAERRLAVVESLVLDPNRRLLLIRCDEAEHLLLLGEGRLLTGVPSRDGDDVLLLGGHGRLSDAPTGKAN